MPTNTLFLLSAVDCKNETCSTLRMLEGSEYSPGLNLEAIEKLRALGHGYVSRGELPSAQMALGHRGQLILSCAWGEVHTSQGTQPASPETLYVGFSTTKAVVSAAIWTLLQQGRLSEEDHVTQYVGGFDTHGKEVVTVSNLLTHTAGFPNAPFPSSSWPSVQQRTETFSSWHLDWEPTTRFHYHGTSTMWVLAAIIEAITEMDFRLYIRDHLTAPLELNDLYVGLPDERQEHVAEISHVGTSPTAESLASIGLSGLAKASPDESYLESYNKAEKRAAGVPGAGGIMTAASLALFYQRLLHPETHGLFEPDTIEHGRVIQTGTLTDPFTGRAANRSLGLVIAGDEDRVYRSFAPSHSPHTFGHPGAGGQIGWADPASGLSFAFLTNGCERNPLNIGMRTLSLSNQAAQCLSTKDTPHG